MTDFVSKTTELATLVGALHQQGEDDSDLTGILAQLQAAITKRVSSNAEKESLLATSYSNLETQLGNEFSGSCHHSCDVEFPKRNFCF